MPPDPEDITNQQDFLKFHRYRLHLRLQQLAILGVVRVDPIIMFDIDDARDSIRRIKGILQNWGASVEDHPDDEETSAEKPLHSAVEADQEVVTEKPLHSALEADQEVATEKPLHSAPEDNEVSTEEPWQPTPEDIAEQQQLLNAYRRKLAHYLQQRAVLGKLYTESGTAHGIDETREAVRRIKSTLRDRGELIEDYPDDEEATSEQPLFFIGPHRPPHPLKQYIDRQDAHDNWIIEDKLRAMILSEDAIPLTILYGISGSGKSSLAAFVARNLNFSDFPDGVLWTNMSNLTLNDHFLMMLGALNKHWYQSTPRKNTRLRDIFWGQLVGRRMLIVLDNINDTRQLIDLLPADATYIGNCRILVICQHRLNASFLPVRRELKLSNFSEKEALELFYKHMMEEHWFTMNQEKLQEISRRLEYVPQLLAIAARNFADRKISPTTYIRFLRQDEHQRKPMVKAIWAGLELTVQELESEQVDLLEFIGVLAEGDWQDTMLAAVALQPLANVRHTLEVFVDRELIQPIGNHRYRVNSLIREFVQHRFDKRSEYRREAAYILMADYCLNLAQDLDGMLVARETSQTTSKYSVNHIDEAFIQEFRAEIFHEMPHIRKALDWAAQREKWDILRRFSTLSYIDFLKHLITNGFEIEMLLNLATIIEPIVWLVGKRVHFHARSLITSTSCVIRDRLNNEEKYETGTNVVDISIEENSLPKAENRCELKLNITAGQIINGIFDTMILSAVKWIGVKAIALICREVELVDGMFLACDLSRSIWIRCDARGVTMFGTNLSYALLHEVKLRSARLQELVLIGTVLEKVDLRDADLRGANLSGAILSDVDLRNADLRGANLTASSLHNINLNGCQIDGVRWVGAKRKGPIIVDDLTIIKEIEDGIAIESEAVIAPQDKRPRRAQDLIGLTSKELAGADLRAVEVPEYDLTKYDLRGADLRAAVLTNTILENTALDKANLRAADMRGAKMTRANLRGADLRATLCTKTQLRDANIRESLLQFAQLEHAVLRGADLSDANLSATNLHKADLSNAILRNVNLMRANLTDAHLQNVNLQRANLHQANMSGADLTDADLADANCTEADFQDTIFDPARLARTAQLWGTKFAANNIVALLAKAYNNDTFPRDTFLRFAHCTGEFTQIVLSSLDMFGARFDGGFVNIDFNTMLLTYARLAGTFSRVNFCDTNLAHACLGGTFSKVNFTDTDLTGARLNGTFSEVTFHAVNIRGINLQNASFVNSRLEGLDLNEAQLRQAKRLRRTTLPDGTLYDGRFNLVGDREDALNFGINPDDPVEMAELFYKPKKKRTYIIDGRYINVSFAQADLSDYDLRGDFINVDFTETNLSRATLSGNFTEADFSTANLTNATLSGTFHECRF